MKSPRSHQLQLQNELARWDSSRPLKVLAHVVAGGGKSWLPLILRERFPTHKLAWFVPRLLLCGQGADSAKNDFGVDLWIPENNWDPSRGQHGFIASHQRLCKDPDSYVQEFARHPYILCVDECHHAKRYRDGSRNELASAIARLPCNVRLFMTGTVDTNDASFIDAVEYTESASGWLPSPKGSADIYVRYDRRTALDEGALVPITFHYHDGPVKFIGKNGPSQWMLGDRSNKDERPATLFAALRTDLGMQLLQAGIEHWRLHGDRLIVIAARQDDARRWHKVMASMGVEAGLAISDEDDSEETVRLYRKESLRALVTCAMCYEGLDAPPTTHEIVLTHIRSAPWIEQMLGRCWRWSPGKKMCWAFVPDDPEMNDVIIKIQAEEPAGVPGFRGERSGGAGGGNPCVIPLSSTTTITGQKYLDDDVVEAMLRDRVRQALIDLELSENHPLRAELLAAAMEERRVQRSAMPVTVSEEANTLRIEMAARCRRTDEARGVPFGTTQKELYRITRVIFDHATPEELKNVAAQCASYCAKFSA